MSWLSLYGHNIAEQFIKIFFMGLNDYHPALSDRLTNLDFPNSTNGIILRTDYLRELMLYIQIMPRPFS
jgi:hypothetical protein